jgi:spermidine synthase
MRRFFPHLLSFLVGYVSLSQEILWVRIYGFANDTLPQAFGIVVVCYLLGIALGAEVGKRICRGQRDLWEISGYVALASLIIDVGSFYLVQAPTFVDTPVALFATPGIIALIAAGKATLFPIAHHLGTNAREGEVGRSMSKVYASNILGSTMGPLVTGLFLLDFLSTQQCIFLLFGLTSLISCFCFTIAPGVGPNATVDPRSNPFRGRRFAALFSLTLGVAALVGTVAVKDNLYYRLAEKRPEPGPKKVIETKNGMVSLYGEVSGSEPSDDVVLGGNVYDGRTNLSLQRNTNLIDRAVILSALQPHPRRVLVIGLSIGTWLTLIDTFPGIDSIDVVEINEGYLKAIRYYPQQDRTLRDPRVHVFIDDANRWLAAHPDTRYDLVVMNTTYYWRNFASNLLSREFLTEVSRHMASGAILSYNSTEEPDVLKTASDVFKFARRRRNFILASDHDFTSDLHSRESLNRLMSLQLEGQRLFPEHTEAAAEAFIDEHLMALDEQERSAGRPLELITQDNVLTEYRYGRPLFTPTARHFYHKLSDYLAGLGRPKGALELNLLLPKDKDGGYEPLVVVPNRDGGCVAVIINYSDPDHIRLGYFQTGLIHKFTDPIAVDYTKPHLLDVTVPAILPLYSDKGSYPGWTDGAIEASRQAIKISWDGKEVFGTSLDFGTRENWYGPIIGSNTATEGISSKAFNGTVLSQRRKPLLPPSS